MATGRSTRQLLGLVVTALVLALFWWIQGGSDDGTTDDSGAATPNPTSSVSHSGGVDPDSGLRWVKLGDLPSEAKETVALIDSGGPFPYPDDDGKVFENREEILPLADHGYYREYTVPTPGSEDRGARRIVTGAAGEFYWTQDHYSSFERIAL